MWSEIPKVTSFGTCMRCISTAESRHSKTTMSCQIYIHSDIPSAAPALKPTLARLLYYTQALSPNSLYAQPTKRRHYSFQPSSPYPIQNATPPV